MDIKLVSIIGEPITIFNILNTRYYQGCPRLLNTDRFVTIQLDKSKGYLNVQNTLLV
jgi:hypothetical protein